MSNFWSDGVANLVPYVPGEQPKAHDTLIKLNTNEFAYPPSPKVIQALGQAIQQNLQLYPDPESVDLRQAIADYYADYALTPEQVFVSNGSDEALAHAFYAFFKRAGHRILFPDITYSFYSVYCGLYNIDYQTVSLDPEFKINLADYSTLINQANAKISAVIFANPNAPTGIALELAEVEKFVAQHPQILVVVDEAYVDFGAQTAASLIGQYPNLLVLQTFSKSRALAGMRVGFALGQVNLIEALNRVKNSFNSYPLDRLAQVAAKAAIQDKDYFAQTCAKVQAVRTWLSTALQELGFSVLPSKANFIFVTHVNYDAVKIAHLLREHNIIVRHFKQERVAQFLRITIGTPQECEQLIQVLQQKLNVIST